MTSGLTTTNHGDDDRVPPPLLRLSTELLDRIISLSVPPAPKLARRRLATLLSVHPTLTPIVRRALYRKVSLIVGDPRKSDHRLLNLLEAGNSGTGPASEHVQYLRIRLPDPPQSILLHPGQDPAYALLPRPHLDPVQTLKFVGRVIDLVPHVRHIELNLQVGLDLEGEQNMRAGDGNESAAAAAAAAAGKGGASNAAVRAEAMRRLEEGLKRWAPRLETCISAVEDPKQRLQVWADASESEDEERSQLLSPQIRALASWHNLSRLDLWRVRLVLPGAFLLASATAPTFRLAELVLTQCQLGGAGELEWLLGSMTAPTPRSSRLNKLVLDCVEFDETPGSSAPIRTVFEAGPNNAHLPFSTTLECLTLILPHPIVPTSAAATEQSLDLFSSLTALRAVELGGPGITEPILVSLFGSPDPLPRSGAASSSASTPPPSSGIRELLLGYLTSIRFSRLLSYLNPSPAKLASLSSFATHPFRDLESLTFKTTWELPREWTWEQRQRTREPLWTEVHFNTTQLAWRDEVADDGDADVAGWDKVEEAVKQLVRERTKLAIRSGVTTSDRAPLRLFKNRLEYTYDYDDSASDSDSATGTAARATRSGSEMDPNALFEPSDSGDNDEDHNAWVRRRIEEEEDYESDF